MCIHKKTFTLTSSPTRIESISIRGTQEILYLPRYAYFYKRSLSMSIIIIISSSRKLPEALRYSHNRNNKHQYHRDKACCHGYKHGTKGAKPTTVQRLTLLLRSMILPGQATDVTHRLRKTENKIEKRKKTKKPTIDGHTRLQFCLYLSRGEPSHCVQSPLGNYY